jgi:Cwf15/Cwc15 cell cycle control protein
VNSVPKRQLEIEQGRHSPDDEDLDAKRRRILEETRDIDADSDGGDSDSSEEESDEEDETAELMRELEKIKRERAEQKAKEVGKYPTQSKHGSDSTAGSGKSCQRRRTTRRGDRSWESSVEPQGIQCEEALG